MLLSSSTAATAHHYLKSGLAEAVQFGQTINCKKKKIVKKKNFLIFFSN